MRNVKGLFFAPEITFENFASYVRDLEQFDTLIEAFKKRVSNLFLMPAALLADKGVEGEHDFAVGLLCCCVIDLLATLEFGRDMSTKDGISNWLTEYVEEFRKFPEGLSKDDTVATLFARHFRHGLVHQGSIGGLGQFSSKGNELWSVGEPPWVGLIINPSLLLERVEKGLEKYCEMLTTPAQREKFIKQIKLQFEPELSAVSSRKARRLKSGSRTPPGHLRRL
jgi:hypothetical protein